MLNMILIVKLTEKCRILNEENNIFLYILENDTRKNERAVMEEFRRKYIRLKIDEKDAAIWIQKINQCNVIEVN